ncbi:MAG TPA: hypothetical protein VF278_07360 [Pirellulales bacterium]
MIVALCSSIVFGVDCVLSAAAIDDGTLRGAAAAERAKFLMTGLRDARERLRKGVVRVHGTKRENAYNQKPLAGELTQFYAFDNDSGLLRYERKEPRRSFVATPIDKPAIPQRGVRPTEDLALNRIYWRCPRKSVQYTAGDTVLAICAEDADAPIYSAFDVRAVGLHYLEDYQRQTRFEEIVDTFMRFPAEQVSDVGDGVYRIEWSLGDRGHHRRTLWIDRSHGFTPTRMELRDRLPHLPDDHPWKPPYAVTEATWTLISDVWVPKTYKIADGPEDSEAALGHHPSIRYEHTFEWESVNEPLPPDLFEVKSLELPNGCIVTDWRGQRPIVEAVIGQPNSPLLGEAGSAKREAPPAISSWRIWIMLVNIALLVALGVFVAVRRWTRRRAAARRD